MIRELKHSPCLAFRAPADKAHIFQSILEYYAADTKAEITLMRIKDGSYEKMVVEVMIRELKHSPCLAFRAPADKAHIFVIVFS